MLFLLILVLYVSSIDTQSNKDNKTKNASADCILPPQPKNGHYEVLGLEIPTSPGDKLNNFTLEVTCDPGFHNTESVIHLCFDGETLFPMPECLPYCNQVKPDVFSCGAGVIGQESKCLMMNQLSFDYFKDNTDVEEMDCGSTGPVSAQIISGGRIAERQELPWHAGIYTKTKKPYMQICGGSLVSPTVVISAAHCFWSDIEKQRPASNYAVAVGKLYRPWNDQQDKNAQKSDVAEIKIPSRFQGSATNLQDDIALVIVTSPFEYTDSVKPVCLDFDVDLDAQQLAPGREGKVAGWGLTSDNGRESPILKVVEMPVIDVKECIEKSDPTFRVHITSDKICAGYQNGTAVCRGDSGGGLSFPKVTHGTSRYVLRGIVSAAPRNQNLCNTVSWATFTHVQKHEHFIRETVPKSTSSANAAVPISISQQGEDLPTADLVVHL